MFRQINDYTHTDTHTHYVTNTMEEDVEEEAQNLPLSHEANLETI